MAKANSSAPEHIQTWREVIRFLRDIDPYRYSKEFAVAELQAVRSEFIDPLKENDDSKLIQTLRKLYPGFCMTYTREADKPEAFDLQSVGPFNPKIWMAYEAFDDLLIQAAERQLPPSINESTLSDLIQRDIQDDDSGVEYEVPLWRIINECGSNEFWSAIGIFRSRMEQAEQEAMAVIALHEKRKLIFTGKKSPSPKGHHS